MKSFNQLLVDLNDGSTLAGLTGDLAELLQAVQNTGRTGSMTLKIKIASASKGGGDVATLREQSGYVVLLGTP